MAHEAPRLNISMRFLDGGGADCPAAQVIGVTDSGGDRIVKGALYDEQKLQELAEGCDVVTMEIEHVGVGGLAKLENEGVNVNGPSLESFRIKNTHKRYIVTRQRQASGFVAARLGSDMVVGTYVGKEVGV